MSVINLKMAITSSTSKRTAMAETTIRTAIAVYGNTVN